MIKLNGIIVVEGRDDKTALSRVLDANIFILNGMSGANNKKIDDLKKLSENNTIYLLTDPDFAGIKIREKINSKIDGIINLYADRKKATKDKNIGIENMKDEDIIDIFKNIRYEEKTNKEKFSMKDILDNNLSGNKDSKLRREILGEILSISYSNTKQLLKKLNALNITRDEFEDALKKVDEMYDKKDKNAAIFGKFFPVHKGHINFIKTVSKYCDKLYVFVCEETIRDKKLFEDSSLPKFITIKDRKFFVEKELKGYKNIEVLTINEDGIKPYPDGWLNWSKIVKEAIEKYDIRVDIVFTNEIQDVKNYEKYLGKKAYFIDKDRLEYNVSSTKIRKDIEKYIEYIPNSVRKFFGM
ncbi:ribonuclease M5 [Oceanivirga salmonicida]|uniref:ribonuclease M5 n=1 Tax=Oceanivirga salmonicida TaxID=1769291 RepID=UPI0012E1338A|nr:ribonuclease M5 [Oceanivirga salmonicida]